MIEKQYYKLVRDNIPDIITEDGNIPIIRVLSDAEYLDCLNEKLKEEVEEYLHDGNTEEICDILEVLYAILSAKGISVEEIEQKRTIKAYKNGAFNEKIFLEKVIVKE
ncbi:nucleoside triphosphate pyrophosphohydrolase [Paludicola sp. MB14-C6]|uniref:nucleoside triphosphate pyrophosphohydrolase n=1 Tax=Paludihabitans sp. MB14-C6 TaxID=3070656 RepID=UPI0027DE7A83|nr:nucleoside triphosphate pyrophosphohydrolase [Paludicola sp. MB14-C6]WMJ23632.1 nucleoside triphosphate pyrophosphohydrolase [Paludicola sp. MB14-C6]